MFLQKIHSIQMARLLAGDSRELNFLWRITEMFVLLIQETLQKNLRRLRITDCKLESAGF